MLVLVVLIESTFRQEVDVCSQDDRGREWILQIGSEQAFDQDCSHGRLLVATWVGHNTAYDGPLHKILRASGR